jgi:hypothetical protein
MTAKPILKPPPAFVKPLREDDFGPPGPRCGVWDELGEVVEVQE